MFYFKIANLAKISEIKKGALKPLNEN